MTVTLGKKMNIAIMLIMAVVLFMAFIPVSGFAEPMILANSPGSQPAADVTTDPSPVLYHTIAAVTTTPTTGVTVKPWTSSEFALNPSAHTGWVSSDQIVSSYAELAKNGVGMSYPGGMAADIGGGGSMGGSGGGGGGCGCGG